MSKIRKERKKVAVTTRRLTEDARCRLLLKIALAFPHSKVANAKLAYDLFPELGYPQNAYGVLKSACKRGVAEALEGGTFRFTEAAVSILKDRISPKPAKVAKVRKVAVTRRRMTEDARSHLLLRIALAFPHSTLATAKLVCDRFPELEYQQNAYGVLKSACRRDVAEAYEGGYFRFTESAVSILEDRISTKSGKKKGRPAAKDVKPVQGIKTVTRSREEEVALLLELSRQYREAETYKIEDFVLPRPRFSGEIYGKADIGSGKPPVCVVVDICEPSEPQAPNDIVVLFLDARHQAHVTRGPSQQFYRYQGRSL